jgi:hypothetical protein
MPQLTGTTTRLRLRWRLHGYGELQLLLRLRLRWRPHGLILPRPLPGCIQLQAG